MINQLNWLLTIANVVCSVAVILMVYGIAKSLWIDYIVKGGK